MKESIICAGYGGQGVLFTGKLICLSAMKKDHNVSHIPSYGAEMRGGTANCAVVVSDDDIASPLVNNPSTAIVMNHQSYKKFEPMVQKNGLLLVNSSLTDEISAREDIEVHYIDANKLAQETGSQKSVNMILLGALCKLKPHLSNLTTLIDTMKENISKRYQELLELNIQALQLGFNAV